MPATTLIFWLSLLMALASHVRAEEPLHLGTYINAHSPGLHVCEQVLREAYARLGRSIEVEHLPAERSLYWANSGRLDGELCRVQDTEGLLPVPTKLYDFRLSAFSIRPLPVTSWTDLQPYKIAYERGMRPISQHTELDLTPVNSIESGILLLDKQRVDIFLDDHYSVLYTASKMNLEQPLLSQPVIVAVPAYHLLNKKHAALATQLNRVLQEMQESGRMQQIEQQVMARFFPEGSREESVALEQTTPD